MSQADELARKLATPESLTTFAARLNDAAHGAFADPGPASELVEVLVQLGAAVVFSHLPGEPASNGDARDVLCTITRQPLILQANGETVEDALAQAARTLAEMGGMA